MNVSVCVGISYVDGIVISFNGDPKVGHTTLKVPDSVSGTFTRRYYLYDCIGIEGDEFLTISF